MGGRGRMGWAGVRVCVVAAILSVMQASAAGSAAGEAARGQSQARVVERSSRGPSRSLAYGSGWSAVHSDAANSDYSWRRGARDLSFAWQRHFDGAINLGATFDAPGRVYVTTTGTGCHLHVLDLQTGETIWCSEAVDRLAVISAALIDRQGRAFLADGEAMHAFGRDGEVLWETPIVGVPLSAQFTRRGNLVFVTHIGRVYLLDRRTGRSLVEPVELIPGATFDPAQGVAACAMGRRECPSANTPAVDGRTGRLFFTFWTPGAESAGVRAMRIVEGRHPRIEPLWVNDEIPGGSASSPTLSVDARRLYVTDNAGNLRALRASNGGEIWSHPIGYASGGSPSVSPRGLVMTAGGNGAPALAVRDRGDRAETAWTNPAIQNRGVATQASGGVAYLTHAAGAGRNELVVVAASDGDELDREQLPGTSLFTVGTTVGPDGTVFVPTITGNLNAFRPERAPST